MSSCPPCFRCFLAAAHLIQMNGSSSDCSRARWWADHLTQVCWSRETSKTCRAGSPPKKVKSKISTTIFSSFGFHSSWFRLSLSNVKGSDSCSHCPYALLGANNSTWLDVQWWGVESTLTQRLKLTKRCMRMNDGLSKLTSRLSYSKK